MAGCQVEASRIRIQDFSFRVNETYLVKLL